MHVCPAPAIHMSGNSNFHFLVVSEQLHSKGQACWPRPLHQHSPYEGRTVQCTAGRVWPTARSGYIRLWPPL